MARDDIAPKSSRFIAMASVCVVVGALYFARDVMVPLAVAVLLSFLLAPLVHRVQRLGAPRALAVFVVVIFSFAIIGGVGWLITNQITAFAERLGDYQGEIEHKIQNVRSRFGHGAFARASETLNNVAREVAASQPADGTDGKPLPIAQRGTPDNPITVEVTSGPATTSSALKVISDSLGYVAPLGQMFIVIVFVIFMLIRREDLRDRLIRLVGPGQLTLTTQALDDAGQRVSRYLLAQSLLNSVVGIIIGTGLYLLKIPNAPLWGLLCGLLRFIPYVGIWIGAAFPIILSLVIPEGYFALRPVVTLAMFVGIEVIAANFVEPLLYGSTTGVSSLAILVAAVFWTWLWGGVGLLLSTPLTVILAVLGKYVPQMKFLDVLLGDEPVLAPFERYYQRLLADDPEEAEDLIEEFEKTKNAKELYSEVLLPALQAMERDFRQGVLDEKRRNFILQAMQDEVDLRRQKLVVLREEEAKKANVVTPATVPVSAPATDHKGPNVVPTFKVPSECVVNVLCLPAHDKADEIVASMLAHLLAEQNYCAFHLTTDALASEMVESVQKLAANVVVISALPPGATAHARYLCKKLHARFPDIQMLIGLWGAKGDLRKPQERISCAASVHISGNFDDALKTIHQIVQPLLIRAMDASAVESAELAGKK
jgi:predicted PurR-regulated permease PerM